MIIESLTVFVGVVLVLLLAEIIIKNSVELSKHYGFSGTFIGLTVLSIGTSIPEIMTHIIGSINIIKEPALMNTLSALVIGTNIGSDIFQQNFVLPLVGLVGVVIVIKKNLFTEVGALIGAALLVWLFSLGGMVTRIEGLILLLAYIAYLIYLKKSKISEEYSALNHLKKKEIAFAIGLILISFIIMALSAGRVLDASTILVKQLPISASFFGVILLGVASALPELTTSLIAITKGKKGLSAGILIGSNITNPLLGIGLGALISSYTVPNVIILFDLPVKILTAVLLYYFLMRNEKLDKKEAIVLMVLFVAYLVVRQIYFPIDF